MRTSAVLLLLLVAGSTSCRARPALPRPRHVVLVSLDTLRADQLGCYGNQVVETPELDAFARQAVRFDQVQSAATTTLASHVSIFTGKWPHDHGVVRNGFLVNASNETLAEVLKAAGFRTAGFVGSFALTHLTFVDQGFDHWDDVFKERIRTRDPEPNQRRAEDVTDAVLAWLDQAGTGAPTFVFAHYFDAHHPYDPPAPYDELYPQATEGLLGDVEDQRRAVAEHQEAILGASRGLDDAIVNGLVPELVLEADGRPRGIDTDLAARYAGEVSYLDHHLGRLFEGLRQRGLWDDTLVIVTADHGETFWEHGDFWNHGLGVYQTTAHVPLLIKLPGGSFGGTVVREPVSSVDLLPTVLELLDQKVPEGVSGVSLVGALAGGKVGPRDLFSEATQPARKERAEFLWRGACKAKAVRDGRWKYIWTPYLQVEELYDLASDPGERVNLLAGVDPAARARARDLRSRLDAWARSAEPLPSRFFRAGDAGDGRLSAEDVIQTLRGLGYVGGEIEPGTGACTE